MSVLFGSECQQATAAVGAIWFNTLRSQRCLPRWIKTWLGQCGGDTWNISTDIWDPVLDQTALYNTDISLHYWALSSTILDILL